MMKKLRRNQRMERHHLAGTILLALFTLPADGETWRGVAVEPECGCVDGRCDTPAERRYNAVYGDGECHYCRDDYDYSYRSERDDLIEEIRERDGDLGRYEPSGVLSSSNRGLEVDHVVARGLRGLPRQPDAGHARVSQS